MLKKFEQFLKRVLLKLLLLFNKSNRSDISNPVITPKNKILFVRLNRIGDALVSTPLIDIVKKKTGCKIYVLADRKNYFVFSNNPHIDRVIVFQKGFKGFISILKFIQNEQIDIMVDLHDDISTTVTYLFAITCVKYKFGLKKINSDIYTHTVQRPDSSSHHIIDRILKLSELFNINYSKDEIKIGYYSKTENLNYAKEIIDMKFPIKKFIVGINISAGSDARFWGVYRFREIIELLKKYDINILLFSDLKDYDKAKSIINEKFIYPVSKDFDKFVSGVLQVNLLFSPDTSVIHIASMKNIPVFGLYVKYKTQDMIWSPYNSDFECIVTEEPTLKNILVEEVEKKFIPFLEKHLNAKRSTKL